VLDTLNGYLYRPLHPAVQRADEYAAHFCVQVLVQESV
jgi:hypothetical protein